MNDEFINVTSLLDLSGEIQIRAGRDSFVGPVQAREITMTFVDPAGILNPNSRRSPLYGMIVPFKPLRLVAPGAPAGYQEHVLNDAPASFWKLDTISGTSVADAGSTPHTGTINGGAAVTLRQLPCYSYGAGYSFLLDGAAGYLTFGDFYDFPVTAAFTLEAWIRPTIVDATLRRVFSKEAAADGWALYHSTAGITLIRTTSLGSDSCTYAAPLVAGTFYHLVATYDGTNMRLYLNGGQVAGPVASSRSLPGNVSAFTVGRQAQAAAGFFAGQLDELAVYNSALTAGRVVAHYNAGRWPEPTYADTVDRPLFTGLVRRIRARPSRKGETVVTGIDMMIGLAKSKPPNGTSLLSGNETTPMTTILNAVSFPSGLRRIDAGGIAGMYAAATADGTTDALSLLDSDNQIAQGFIFISNDGYYTYKKRGWRVTVVPAATILNVTTLQDAEIDEALVINKANVTRTGGILQTVSDSASIATYGETTFELTSPRINSDAIALALAQFVVDQNKSPSQRVRAITLDNRTEGTLQQILARDLAQKVYVQEAEQGTGGEYMIEGIQLSLGPARIQATWALTAFPT